MVGILPIVIFAIYLAIYISLPYIAFKRGGRGVAEYLVAKGALGKITGIFTLIATYVSVYGFIGYTAAVYTAGYDWLLVDLTYNWFILVPMTVLLGFRVWKLAKVHNPITPGDFIALRTGSDIARLIYAILVFWAASFYIGIQFIALSGTASALTGISYHVFLVVFVIVAVVAIFIGGLRGVAYTDTLNGILFLSVLAIFIGFLISRWGSLNISEALRNPIFQRTLPTQYFVTAYLIAIAWPVLVPHIWIRYHAIKRRDTITTSILSYALVWAVLYCIMPYILVMAFAAWWATPPKVTVPEEYAARFFSELIGPAVATTAFLGILGAGISTADSIIQTCVAILYRDILETIVKPIAKWPEKKRELLARSMTIVVILFAMMAAYAPALPIIRIGVLFIWPLYSILAITVILALFWRRVNKYGFIAGLLVGSISQLLLQFVIWPTWPHNPWYLWEGALPTIIAGIATVIVSLITPPPPKDIIEKFYRE
jgi:Na+/proline symporter